MLVELHIIQNFAPANLNRDDTGSPKDCEFGGYRRARISSQCLKRAARVMFRDGGLLQPTELATRTKRLVEEVVRRLAAKGWDQAQAETAVETALASVGFQVDENTNKTEYLLYLGEQEIDAIVEACYRHQGTLMRRAEEIAAQSAGGRQSRRDAKRDARKDAPKEVVDAINAALDGGRAADLALFGRMLADLPDRNVDAAAQVAHALSTHQVTTDFDYYTAVDDLKPEDTAGADMIGTVEFNSACFYRYANVNVDQLLANLNNDTELAQKALKAFVRACIEAVPTGKQNSFAAHNPPSFVFSVVRERGMWSLANAFVRPVRPDSAGDLIQNSIRALDRYWQGLVGMYGDDGIRARHVVTLEPDVLTALAACRVANVDVLVEQTVAKAFAQQGGGRA